MRNYQNEEKWRRSKYDIIKACVEKDLGQSLRIKLKNENKTIAGWIRENIKKYIKE